MDVPIKNAIIYPIISMAKREGRQAAAQSLADLHTVFGPRVNRDVKAVDVCGLLTAGLYDNTAIKTPSETRHDSFRALGRYYRDWQKAAQDLGARDDEIIPSAFRLSEWDVMARAPAAAGKMAAAIGALHAAYDTKTFFRDNIEAMAESFGRAATHAQRDFFLEEFAFSYLLLRKEIYMARDNHSLRHDDGGAVFIAYPGPLPVGMAQGFKVLLGKNKIAPDQSYFVNIQEPCHPIFHDFADVMDIDLGQDIAFSPSVPH